MFTLLSSYTISNKFKQKQNWQSLVVPQVTGNPSATFLSLSSPSKYSLNGNYIVYQWTGSGTVSSNIEVFADAVVIGGGGGGGSITANGYGPGGNAGNWSGAIPFSDISVTGYKGETISTERVVFHNPIPSSNQLNYQNQKIIINQTSMSIAVGAGGTGAWSSLLYNQYWNGFQWVGYYTWSGTSSGSSGSNSSLGSIVASGGKSGNGLSVSESINVYSLGSPTSLSRINGTGIANQGGYGGSSFYNGGNASTNVGGNGSDGIILSIYGLNIGQSMTPVCGGGGGGGYTAGGNGGIGGGGAGGSRSGTYSGTSGAANSGGGGGGTAATYGTETFPSINGGSGSVWIRFQQ